MNDCPKLPPPWDEEAWDRRQEWVRPLHCRTGSTKLVLMLMVAFADETNRVSLSIKCLAKMGCMSPRTASRAIGDLRFAGLIAACGEDNGVTVFEIAYREAQP